MDNRPIGIFDSGLGGLTAVKAMMDLLPNEDIIYLGDTGRIPYGTRSRETIISYTRQDIAFLRQFDIKAILIACGTASTTALEEVAGQYDVPIYGVVDPAARMAAEQSSGGRIGVIATPASIRSGAYTRAIRKFAPEAQVFGQACPLFVPLVENGRIHRGDVVIETVAAEYLKPLKEAGVDTLILGCTHYPLLCEVIADYLGPDVRLISSGAAAAAFLAEDLAAADQLSGMKKVGSQAYYVTDSAADFAQMASAFLGQDIFAEASQVSL